jgi:osmotically-inducible protein OsmY
VRKNDPMTNTLRTLRTATPRCRRHARAGAASAALVAVALAAAACAGAPAAPPAQRDDAEISRAVTAELAAAELNTFQIQVDTRDGVVTLSGSVTAADQRVEAEKLARGTPGVRRVINLLEVDGVSG